MLQFLLSVFQWNLVFLYICASVCSSLKMARKRLHVNVVWCGCMTVVQFSSRFSISLLKSKQSTPNLWSSITSTATLSCAAVGLVHCCPCTLSLYSSFSFFFCVCSVSNGLCFECSAPAARDADEREKWIHALEGTILRHALQLRVRVQAAFCPCVSPKEYPSGMLRSFRLKPEIKEHLWWANQEFQHVPF